MSEQRQAAAPPADPPSPFAPLEIAVLLPPPPCGARAGGSAVGPLTRVAGLPIILRNVLALQRGGIREVVVVADDEDGRYREAVRDRRVAIPLQWRSISEFPLQHRSTWEALLVDRERAVLVLDMATVLTPAVVPALNRLLRRRPLGLRPQPADGLPGRFHRSDGEPTLPIRLLAIPARVGGPSAPATELRSSPLSLDTTLPAAVLGVAAEAGALDVVTLPPSLCLSVDGPEQVPDAERGLLRGLHEGKVFEGWVDTHLNRRLSPALSRLFLAAGLSPNAITGVSTAIGLLGALLFATSHDEATVLGALLLQASAIVDCCDGEVARVTFAESRLGEQLDLAADNLVHLTLFGAMAWGLYLRQPWSMSILPALPLLLGAIAIVANLLSLILVVRAKRLREHGRLTGPEQAARLDLVLKRLANRDFSVLVILAAVLGWLDWFLWVAAIGANVFWIMLAWITRPSTLHPVRRPS